MRDSGMPNSIRRSATTRKIPTPVATARMITMLGTAGTCSARTCRSGSDTVMIKPRTKPRITITHSFLERVMLLPTRSPMGVMAISAPRVKNIIPITSITAPIIYSSIMPGEMGTMVKHSASTIMMIGSTALTASFSFSFSLSFNSIL